MLRHSWIIFTKDLRMEFRSKESLNAAVAFSLVVLVLFSFAFDPTSEQIHEISGGLLWILFAFAGVLLVNRSFAREQSNDCMNVLISSRVPASALLLGKSLANTLFILLVEAVCLPVFGIFYNINLFAQPFWMLLVCLLGTWAIAIIGTVFAAMTVSLRLRELMLPVMVYPMIIPALAAAMQLTTVLSTGKPLESDNMLWVRVLIGFDIIFTALALGLIDTVLVD
ncbi:heme exporter protein CcmB [Bryobacter aggregatus]|uniref:heme exporter protein CcmB n=1 Tax=Bryobacter aggregatus TaxID=360054 RepID=UPI0004E14B35|nr:heme exporter protein CcmB [Bryobacter aggregatus]